MKRYQAVAFLLSTAMTVTSVAPVFGAANDISGHWAQATITKWQDAGRIGGYEDGTFKPDRTITRAEFVRLLNTATSTSFTSNASVNFSDVKESDWFYADVAKAVGAKITSGFEDGTFRPSETVTRMQAAVFICNAKGLALNEAGANLLTDAAQIPAWAKGAVGAVISAGYMSGYPDGSFGGAKGMTRAEAVSTLDRVLGGGVTTPAPDNQGVSTPDTNQDTTIADAKQEGNMVWKSGGGGGGSSSKKDDGEDKKHDDKDVKIASAADAREHKGHTLTGTTTIELTENLELNGITFDGPVNIISKEASSATAAAYIGSDAVVAAANSRIGEDKFTIKLTNGAKFNDEIKVRPGESITNAKPVEIVTETTEEVAKTISNLVAEVATRIVGFTTTKVQASAPVQIAAGSVTTIAAETGAEITVESDAKVAKLEVTGDTKVTVQDGASIENVAVGGTANAEITLEGTAKVTDITVEDKAIVAVDIPKDAEVGKYTSTSTANGSKITGEGKVTGGVTVVEGTTEVSKTIEADVKVTPKDEKTEVNGTTVAGLKITAPTAETTDMKVVADPITGVTVAGTWTKGTTDETTKKTPYTATITLTAADGFEFAADVADLTADDFKNLGIDITIDTDGVSYADGTLTIKVTALVDAKTEEPDDDKVPATVEITAVTDPIQKDTSTTFEATVKNTAGTTITEGYTLKWELLDEKDAPLTIEGVTLDAETGVLTVTADAKIEAETTAKVKVTVDGTDITNTTNITLSDEVAQIKSIVIALKDENAETTLKPGDTLEFTVTGKSEADGTGSDMALTDKGTVTWSASDNLTEAIGSIEDGVLTIKAEAEITDDITLSVIASFLATDAASADAMDSNTIDVTVRKIGTEAVVTSEKYAVDADAKTIKAKTDQGSEQITTATTVDAFKANLTPSTGASMKVVADATSVTDKTTFDAAAEVTALVDNCVLCVISEDGKTVEKYTVTVTDSEDEEVVATITAKSGVNYDIVNPTAADTPGTIAAAEQNGTAITTETTVKELCDNLTVTKPSGGIIKVSVSDTDKESTDSTTTLVTDATILKVFENASASEPVATYTVTVTAPEADTTIAEIEANAGSNYTIKHQTSANTPGTISEGTTEITTDTKVADFLGTLTVTKPEGGVAKIFIDGTVVADDAAATTSLAKDKTTLGIYANSDAVTNGSEPLATYNVTVTDPGDGADITVTADNNTVTLDGTAKTVTITATVPTGTTGDVTFAAEAGTDDSTVLADGTGFTTNTGTISGTEATGTLDIAAAQTAGTITVTASIDGKTSEPITITLTAPTVEAATNTATIQGGNSDGAITAGTSDTATITLTGSTFDTTLAANEDITTWFEFTNNDSPSTVTAAVKEVSENTITIQFSGTVAETSAQTITKITIPGSAINGLKSDTDSVEINSNIGITFERASQ